MKTIGLLGGMSWESSVEYYSIINKLMNKELGGHSSAKIILNSLEFASIESLQTNGDWDSLNRIMVSESKKIELAGADVLVICTNTMHKCYDTVSEVLSIPIIHIADTTGEKIKEQSITKIGLLGTIYTMKQDFYKQRLSEKFDLEVVIPNKSAMEQVNTIIFEELVFGITSQASKENLPV